MLIFGKVISMENAKKASRKYSGYTFSTVGTMDKDRFLNLLGNICGEKFNQHVEVQRIVKKSDATDNRLFTMVQ